MQKSTEAQQDEAIGKIQTTAPRTVPSFLSEILNPLTEIAHLQKRR